MEIRKTGNEDSDFDRMNRMDRIRLRRGVFLKRGGAAKPQSDKEFDLVTEGTEIGPEGTE